MLEPLVLYVIRSTSKYYTAFFGSFIIYCGYVYDGLLLMRPWMASSTLLIYRWIYWRVPTIIAAAACITGRHGVLYSPHMHGRRRGRGRPILSSSLK